MISKKSRKVVAALLIGATICASGTFAYFNATTNLSDIDGVNEDGADKLAITNGYIEIKGKIKGSTATKTSELWAYDVARVSTLKDMGTNADFKALMNDTYGIPTDATTLTGMAMTETYKEKNASPDILGLTDDEAALSTAASELAQAKTELDAIKGNSLATEAEKQQKQSAYDAKLSAYNTAKDGIRSVTNRAKIGTGVAGAITQARPGDAFALGGAIDGQDITESGIEIVNNSNLTTKVGIGLNTNDLDNVKAQLDAMNANGWKVYIKVSGVDAGSTNPYADWIEINSAFVDGGTDTICQIASVKPGDSNPILQMRVELPLLTQNDQQKKSTGEGLTGGLSDFDIANMFEIVATQENNPGWNQLGSSDRPIETNTPATK